MTLLRGLESTSEQVILALVNKLWLVIWSLWSFICVLFEIGSVYYYLERKLFACVIYDDFLANNF